jgi:hypothetical protein
LAFCCAASSTTPIDAALLCLKAQSMMSARAASAATPG